MACKGLCERFIAQRSERSFAVGGSLEIVATSFDGAFSLRCTVYVQDGGDLELLAGRPPHWNACAWCFLGTAGARVLQHLMTPMWKRENYVARCAQQHSTSTRSTIPSALGLAWRLGSMAAEISWDLARLRQAGRHAAYVSGVRLQRLYVSAVFTHAQ